MLDLALPVLSGHVVKQELSASAERRHIPVVIVTGSSEPLEHLDASSVLRKPVTPEALVETVERCLRSHHSHARRKANRPVCDGDLASA